MRVLFRLSLAASVVLLFGIYASCGGGDSGSGTPYFADVDGDSFGDVNNSQILDEPQAGWVLDSTDCDDNLVGGYPINPDASEVCDDWVDNDCNDYVDCNDDVACAGTAWCAGCVDADSDGYYAVTLSCAGGNDCADADSTVNPGVDADGDTLDACQDCNDADSTMGTNTAEVCNNFDDDCDGETDETSPGVPLSQACYTGVPATRGVGLCSDGSQVCSAGMWGVCTGEVTPSTEICDGLDNDCDGFTDESFPENGQPCTVPGQQGVCSQGTYTACTSGTPVCSQVNFPSSETCNGLDDDCNGTADDGLTGSLCPEQDGVCVGSRETCGGSAGWLACNSSSYGSSYETSEATCDGLDNDCDGVVDDNLTAPPCSQQSGVCAGSTKTCGGSAGWLACSNSSYGSSYETSEATCDGLDNDCDGAVDDGVDADCGFCEKCSGGACVNQAPGEDVKDECTAYTCADYVYGWNFSGTDCLRYAGPTSLNGDCDGAGACADVTGACSGFGTVLASCGDAGCSDQCPAGALASSYDTVSEVCFTSGQNGCGAGQTCDATGTCQ